MSQRTSGKKKRPVNEGLIVNSEISVNVKILKEGDHVLNIWFENSVIQIAVRHKNEEVEIFSLEPDEQGLPCINYKRTWYISFGDREIEILGNRQPSENIDGLEDVVKVTTF